MKATLSIVLGGLFVAIPLEQAIAQAEQTAPQSSTFSPALLGVPALEPGSAAALLWLVHAAAPSADSLAYGLRLRRAPTAEKVSQYVGVAAGVALQFYRALSWMSVSFYKGSARSSGWRFVMPSA